MPLYANCMYLGDNAGADEIGITAWDYELEYRLHSFELLVQAHRSH